MKERTFYWISSKLLKKDHNLALSIIEKMNKSYSSKILAMLKAAETIHKFNPQKAEQLYRTALNEVKYIKKNYFFDYMWLEIIQYHDYKYIEKMYPKFLLTNFEIILNTFNPGQIKHLSKEELIEFLTDKVIKYLNYYFEDLNYYFISDIFSKPVFQKDLFKYLIEKEKFQLLDELIKKDIISLSEIKKDIVFFKKYEPILLEKNIIQTKTNYHKIIEKAYEMFR